MHSGMFSHGLELVIGVGGVRTQHPGLRDFPFMAAQGYQPPLFDYQEEKAAVPSVQVYLCRCRRIWQQLHAKLPALMKVHLMFHVSLDQASG